MLVIKPAINAALKIPIPIIKLFTPRYLPSKPRGIVLNKRIEFDVLNIENAITIILEETAATTNESKPNVIGIKNAVVSTAATLGINAIVVARSSPNFEISLGTR